MQIHMRNRKNETNHEEASCEMDCTVRIVFWDVIHLFSIVSWDSIVCLGWFLPKFFVAVIVM